MMMIDVDACNMQDCFLLLDGSPTFNRLAI